VVNVIFHGTGCAVAHDDSVVDFKLTQHLNYGWGRCTGFVPEAFCSGSRR
jgi:hypothetical protein